MERKLRIFTTDEPTKYEKRTHRPRTWKEIKQDIEDKGITDKDVIWSIDIGPYFAPLTIDKDDLGIEIGDDSSELMEEKKT